MSKKRIAFCFSWQARTFDLTYKYFKKNLFDVAKEQWYEYDIFCAIEDDNDADKINIMNPTIIERINSKIIENDIFYKYWEFIKNNFNKKYYFYQTHKYSIINWLHQFYKIHRANYIKNKYSNEKWFKYDMVVKLRYDIIFLNKINFIDLFKDINNAIILNKIPNLDNFIYDHFAFWNTENMNIYTNMFTDFENIFRKEIKWFKNHLINQFDKIIQNILKAIYKIFLKWKLIHMIVEQLFYLKLLFLIKNWFFYYNYEKVVYENLINNNINIIDWKIDFLLLRWNYTENPTILFKKSKFEI